MVGLSAEAVAGAGLLSVVGLAKAVGGFARVVSSDSKQRSVKTCNIDLNHLILFRAYPIYGTSEDDQLGSSLFLPV